MLGSAPPFSRNLALMPAPAPAAMMAAPAASRARTRSMTSLRASGSPRPVQRLGMGMIRGLKKAVPLMPERNTVVSPGRQRFTDTHWTPPPGEPKIIFNEMEKRFEHERGSRLFRGPSGQPGETRLHP